tara:strand:+ start:1284 stop:2174 length:891 start_codon:yes stop_codon:yes gene_type:complete
MNSKNKSLISVIVPCYNSGRTLKRTILSIKEQTWNQKEIILVNDGSTDHLTIEVIKELQDEKIIKLINQENFGLAAARNTGVNQSSGNYLFFLDADDWIEPSALQIMYKKLLENNNSGYIFTDTYLEGKRNGFLKNEYNFFEQLFLNQIPYSIFISKKNFIKNGFYDENMKLGYEDWEFNVRLASNNLIGKRVPIPLFHYDVQNTGMLLSKSLNNHVKIWKVIKTKNKDLYTFNNLLSSWWLWRRRPSSYPLFIFFVWYLMLKILPDNLTLKIFLTLRNISLFSTNFKNFILKNIR